MNSAATFLSGTNMLGFLLDLVSFLFKRSSDNATLLAIQLGGYMNDHDLKEIEEYYAAVRNSRQ